MVDSRSISIFDYLRCNTDFNERNFTIIREKYQEHHGGSFPDDLDESAIREVARQLKIRVDTDESWDLLCDCVVCSNTEEALHVAKTNWRDHLKVPISSATVLTDISCLFTMKMAFSQVSTFIRSFFLQLNDASVDQQSFVLDVGCPLYLLIRVHMDERGPVTSATDCNGACFRLMDPIHSNDEFGSWFYDHWQGLFDLDLEPYDNNGQFPKQWCLAENIKIHCRIENCTAKGKTSHLDHLNGLRTASLELFVQDVCKREKNNQSASWLEALKTEDIFSFEHLNNLNKSEWDRMKNLSMNAARALKEAVDRQRTSIAGARCPQVVEVSDDEDNKETDSSVDNSSGSHSELFASLHLIKLFVWYKLRGERIVKRHGALPALEMKCLDTAFDEMRSEGFADDGLFDEIKEFFLSFTISEQERKSKRSPNQDVRLTRCEQLRKEIQVHTTERNKWMDAHQKWDDETCRIERLIKENEAKHSVILTSLKAKRKEKNQEKQLETLNDTEQECLKSREALLKKQHTCKQEKEILRKKIKECVDDIDATNDRIKMIEIELNTLHKSVEKELVKLPRGLIMYGPPGTGKSEILRQLAKKLGIIMIGPPLAGGDLNRSYVGESEQIITALCSRCYQVPYAIGCVSIDEIDSLAPKRSEHSSEGKMDKISVLLSLIDGIKDVPNLMIFSATNRLHMMDEAFLRRMSGKFFVGRPSSDARLKILQKIPAWTYQPELLHQLSMATTNFSGAAVKILIGAITTECMAMQRKNSKYEIDEIKALEIADRTAQQFQIFFGSETLPRLLLRNKLDDTHHSHTYNLSSNAEYTGRMIIDLHSKHIRIEILNKNQLSVIENDLYPNETNVQTLLERLTHYGKFSNVQLLQLIDLNLLASQNAYDQNKIYETLKDRYDECVSYSRSMIVYDLDALVGVKKSESGSDKNRSTSIEIFNHSIYTYILARFRDRIMENVQTGSENRIQRWTVVVIREPFLLRQFYTDAQYPRTRQEQQEEELEKRKTETILKCVKCRDYYIENENNMGSCRHHDGFLIDTEATNLKIYTPSEVISLFRENEVKKKKYPDRHEEFKQPTDKFKWICCDDPFSDVDKGGCKRGKHGFFPNANDLVSRLLIHDGANRLTQPMIEEWEEACRYNEEYREKRTMLLKLH